MTYRPTKILLAIDGSETAALAAEAAVDLADRAGAELHVVHVREVFPRRSYAPIRRYTAREAARRSRLCEQSAEELLAEQVREIQAAGGSVVGVHPSNGRPADEILALGGELGVDLIVLGSRGLGMVKRLAAGSVSEEVARRAACPVLVVRGEDGAWPPRRIIVGDDSSTGAREAGELAVGIGKLFGAEMLLVRAHPVIVPMFEAVRYAQNTAATSDDALRRQEMDLESRARGLEGELGPRPRVRVTEGEATSVILRAAEESGGPALVAVGRRGLGVVDRLRLGSVSAGVLRGANGPVLVVPDPECRRAL